MTAMTSWARASATGFGTISNSCLMPSLARSSPPNTPASAPRKMQNGNSDSTNEKATAPAMAKPLSAYTARTAATTVLICRKIMSAPGATSFPRSRAGACEAQRIDEPE